MSCLDGLSGVGRPAESGGTKFPVDQAGAGAEISGRLARAGMTFKCVRKRERTDRARCLRRPHAECGECAMRNVFEQTGGL